MYVYILFLIIVAFYGASYFDLLSTKNMQAAASLILLCVFSNIFFSYLDNKYYYSKKYLWNFCIGMFLFSFFIIGCILEFLGYMKFIAYFGFLLPIGPTFFFYGLRTLLFLKIENGEANDKITRNYKLIKKSMNTLYFLDVLMLLLYIMVIWKRFVMFFRSESTNRWKRSQRSDQKRQRQRPESDKQWTAGQLQCR